jgi:uncharacterized LabA/DUF88 family protein
MTTRVSAFIDGFNLYHAISNLRADHLKWVNLRRLCENFAPAPQFDLGSVCYFSAFATWRAGSYARHRAYVAALEAAGVTPILGKFKEKDRRCFRCKQTWKDHEEKESDVNLALHLLRGAVLDEYDRALVITQDSDIAPAVRMVLREFPKKAIRIITPVGMSHSFELLRAVGGREHAKSMRSVHVERSLFEREIRDSMGRVVAVRPSEYDPPA